jgi:hypothetical protein
MQKLSAAEFHADALEMQVTRLLRCRIFGRKTGFHFS